MTMTMINPLNPKVFRPIDLQKISPTRGHPPFASGISKHTIEDYIVAGSLQPKQWEHLRLTLYKKSECFAISGRR
jgi:hypothetical protein